MATSTPKRFDFGKYRGILISVALFLLLDASVLMLNFYISYEIADDAQGVNLAGRQRMLSQRIAKSLFVLETARDDQDAYDVAYKELKLSEGLFDTTLNAFISGGSIRGANQLDVHLEPVSNDKGKFAVMQAQNLWAPYKAAIDNLGTDAYSAEGLDAALAMARIHNLNLLKLMNDLTVSLEELAASKAIRLRTIQTVGISLAIINFLIIMFHFVRQLRESDAVIERARRETTEILETVSEGLFLIDKNLIIGEQHSACLSEVLGEQKFGGQSFQILIENIISAKDAETASAFIELLFDPKIKEKLIGDLNPLNLVQVNIGQLAGGFLTKHLNFNFARAYQDGEISHVLVTVVDVSEQIKLQKELADSRKRNETQLELLTSLLHTHPSLLKEFILNSYECYNRINNILRTPAKTSSAVREKAISIFREVHNFKGEAAALKLEYFENAAHGIEDRLTELRNKPDLIGNDYLGLTVQLENLISYTQQIEQLAEKLAQFGGIASPAPVTPISQKHVMGNRRLDGWDNLEDFVQNLAIRNGKQVIFVASGLHDLDLSKEYQQKLKEICIQLLRNAVVHGIETPHDREMSQKTLQGRIDLRIAKLSATELELSVMDDGQGINYASIRDKAIASGHWPIEEVETWTNKQLLGLIFNEGFSTAKEVTKDAGRGVGMEAVMNHVVTHRGKINVSSQRGRHCRFTITLPIVREQEEQAA